MRQSLADQSPGGGSVTQIDRSLGVTETLARLFDGAGEVVLAMVTQLGDVWLLFVLAGSVYVAYTGVLAESRRQQGAFVLALPLVYLALVTAMKGAFELPRPPRAGVAPQLPWLPSVLVPLFENTATATGYGFPSGHAIGTTLVWGGVALVADRWSRWVRAAGVVLVVSLVAFSRLALGVHYLVDVVAGAAIGALVLGAVYLLSERATEPGRVFVVAVVLAVLGVATQQSVDSVLVLGGTLGALGGWAFLVDGEVSLSVTPRALATSAVLFVGTVFTFGVVYLREPPLPVLFGASVVAAAVVVGVPDLGDRVARRFDPS
ncbi:phosphatase PAP2 family protein [Halomarina rubra]|uniref:phosphatase PAP2 family protein n=1 Tax=Halomarina rubra TaxID=2071873 RepID=UPI002032FB1B|nr:phosphatase PAP2 family protein [Halomarina rubra]